MISQQCDRWVVTGASLVDEAGDGLLDGLAVAVARCAAGDYGRVDAAGLLSVLEAVEEAARGLSAVGYEVVARLREHDARTESARGTLTDLLVDRLRISGAEARARISAAKDLAPRVALTGQRLPAFHEATASACRDGDIGAEHSRIIRRFFADLPADVDEATRCEAEDQLVALARRARPEHVRAASERLRAYLDPDGSDSSERARRRKVFFSLDKPGADGLSTGRFCVDAELRAYFEALFAVYAKPGRCDPDDPTGDTGRHTGSSESGGEHGGEAASDVASDAVPLEVGAGEDMSDADVPGDEGPDCGERGTGSDRDDIAGEPHADDAEAVDIAGPGSAADNVAVPAWRRDLRSQGQRNADAVKAALRAILASGNLGSHRGLPVRVVVTAQLADLERAAGFGLTGGGSLVPMRDVIRMASHAYQYLSVFDDAGRPLYLGRAKRIASADQRLVLYAGEGGCTFPGCTSPAYYSQVHHVDEWARGAGTDVDGLTLACERHHRLVGDGEDQWATTRTVLGDRYPGRTLWHPPVGVDPERRGRINHYHHPGEFLTGGQQHRYPRYRDRRPCPPVNTRVGAPMPTGAAP